VDEPSESYLHWERPRPSADEILRRAHDLVAFGWCQGTDATDADRRPVQPWSSRACYWSLLGALVAALHAPRDGPGENPAPIAELRLALIGVSETISAWSLRGWNDDPARSQAEVVEMLAAARHRCAAHLGSTGHD
jgi:hypothetical protein